ncbi:hypothetical protein L2E82_15484 [Cichorium intybus]|uniref:Uncharacterized protein n=1 Tax=Cichorium intybus TaxID=13427 RepID=A0ACB9F3D4_CICIN|nr:hypothetical protein L2E82_15484 [Cichorium intybus]
MPIFSYDSPPFSLSEPTRTSSWIIDFGFKDDAMEEQEKNNVDGSCRMTDQIVVFLDGVIVSSPAISISDFMQ